VITVPAVKDMVMRDFWKHIQLRHSTLDGYSLYQHAREHGENPGLDHIHLGEKKL
jgi:hypothetical protein